MLRDTTAPIPADDGLHEIFRHVRTLGEKDLELALDLAGELGVEMPVTSLSLHHLADGLGVPHTD